MDLRGPPEGAPILSTDSMDLNIIDKVFTSEVTESGWPDDNLVTSSTLDNPKKNNKLLFLTVEYIEDPTKDYGKMFPYEQVSFLSRASSPSSEYEHRVSPHDPNMSSAARYSPTPVSLPAYPFSNSAVVPQEQTNPLISTSKSSREELIDQSTNHSISQSDNSSDFTDSEGLVSSVGSELMLMPSSGSELPEIQESDLSLAREFLASQEDQSGAQILDSILLQELTDKSGRNGRNYKRPIDQLMKLKDEDKKPDLSCGTLWEDSDCTCMTSTECFVHTVCMIADQPVPSRAFASLPDQYLSIEKIPDSLAYGIFAKQNIRRRTQFGPVEGVLRPYDGSTFNGLPLLFEIKNENKFLKVDVSDENTSNWMRFVRPAKTFEEQNLIISQQSENIIFLSTKLIMAGEELKAGPSLEYGERRNIPVLIEPKAKIELDSTVDSYSQTPENENILTSLDLCDSNEIPDVKPKIATNLQLHKYSEVMKYLNGDTLNLKNIKIVQTHVKQPFNLIECLKSKDSKILEDSVELKLEEIMKQEISQSDEANFTINNNNNNNTVSEYKCSTCSKIFISKFKLQQHCLIHGINTQDTLICNICSKIFVNSSSLTRHLKIHDNEGTSLQCPICSEAFGHILKQKDSAEVDSNQDEIFTCPHCPKTFTNYILTRKHARAHHLDRKHECQFCLKSFAASDKLKMHLLSHSDRREFQCANCSKQFKRKDKLKEHVTRVHFAQKPAKDQNSLNNDRAKKTTPKTNQVDCDRFIYKCRRCQIGFKRRGMLVNHLAKRHPDVSPDSVPELCLPILRQTRDYYCQYCDKVYKSSSKRKAHIMKNHPGAALPPSNRSKEIDALGLPNPTFSQAAGSIKTIPQGCQWCHKQYASKAKLLQHQRKKHSSLMEPADQIPRPRSRPPQNQNQPPSSNNNHSNDDNSNNINNNNNNNSNNNNNNNLNTTLNVVKLVAETKESEKTKIEFIKPRIIRVNGNNGGNGEIVINKFDAPNPQLVRVRDMR